MQQLEKNDPRYGALRRFRSDPLAVTGAGGIVLLLALALFAPFLANGRPFWMLTETGWSCPFWRTFFAPDSPEYLIEQSFNYSLLLLIAWSMIRLIFRRGRWRQILMIVSAVLLVLPFVLVKPRMDKEDYRALPCKAAWFAPIPYGPFEPVGTLCAPPDRTHWLGTDDVGRDVASRLIYGSRVSLAVGLGATVIAILIGTIVGMAAGYFRGTFDLVVMRLVEIVMCFPTFLLLLILMAILKDVKFEQSILVVIGVVGLTGWIGVAFLVRGEVLKVRALPFIQSCEVSGIPAWRTMMMHLLPNISGPILISFTFHVAGAILSESGLSFLGFGVQPPTASWGGLLRQAFDDPMRYWHLTLFPGLALFWAVCCFNFTGDGLRKALSPK